MGDAFKARRAWFQHFSGNQHFGDIRGERGQTESRIPVEQENIRFFCQSLEFGNARPHGLTACVLIPFRNGTSLVADREPAPFKKMDGDTQCGVIRRHGAILTGRDQRDNGKFMPCGKIADKYAEAAGRTSPVDTVRGNKNAHGRSLKRGFFL